ncbi:lipid A-modifier LpxR family protein, partial [Salmonella enterica]|uniref:lipid A-modifier LpxR family protein n=1 Tax=Salmonella enterica TaxID=28901 RepID=UPI0020CAC8D9
GKKSAQIREILISESAWEEMTCLFAPSLIHTQKEGLIYKVFAGVERREVDKNYTLQGKTLQTKMETVDINKTVDEYRVGATIGYSPVAFSLSLNKVTSEFRTGDDYSYINGDITFFF